jgi:DNA-binding cell septation regulator SpoVG
MSKFEITARVNPLKDQSKNVKAMASVNIDGVIGINDLTIVEGKNGLFVGYPQSKDKDGNFRDIVEFLKDEQGKTTKESLELKNAISKTLVDMLKRGERQTPSQDGQLKEPVMHEIKAYVTPLRDSTNLTRGLATVQVGELFKFNSIRINENAETGKNFTAMPSRPNSSRESGYSDIVLPIHKEFSEKLRGAVIKQYDNQLAYKNRTADKEQSAQQHEKPPAAKGAHGID